jgi:cell division protein FtsW (lipid II flippase)
MVGMIILLIFALSAIMMLAISYSIKNNDDDDGKNMFLFGIFLLILSILAIGVLIGEDEIKHTKHKVTPVVKVECMNTKCDTTYIYSFKEYK